jgi:branched-chain amino acid transport system permease protein
VNTKYLYWLALGFLAAVFFIARWAVESSPGRVWQAIRENEQRVAVLGLRPHAYKLQAFVLSSVLAAGGGIVYMLLYNSSNPSLTAPEFTLTLLLMVVIGGAGSRWGAVLGGILYHYLDDRLTAMGGSSTIQGLPGVLRTPLEQPLFLLGTVFILIVVFLPGGIAGIAARGRPSGLCRLEEAVRTSPTLTEPQEEA